MHLDGFHRSGLLRIEPLPADCRTPGVALRGRPAKGSNAYSGKANSAGVDCTPHCASTRSRERARARLRQTSEEFDAKVTALQRRVDAARDDRKAALEAPLARIRSDYEDRRARREAASPL
jgi:hypothetical protein